MATQFLKNTRVTLSETFSAGVADGTVTVVATDEAGTVVATGNAASVGLGVYTFALGPFTTLMRVVAKWSGTWGGVAQSLETEAEVVSAHLFTIAEARAYRDKQLNDTVAYPDSDIREARDRITDDFQVDCGVPFFPRYEREVLTVTSAGTLWLPWKRPLSLISITVDGVALTAGELAAVVPEPTGRLTRTGGWTSTSPQSVVAEWVRGHRKVPTPIKRAALALAHYELIGSEITDRMVSFANELGTVRLSTPGRKTPTGIPIVDATLYNYDERETAMVAVR